MFDSIIIRIGESSLKSKRKKSFFMNKLKTAINKRLKELYENNHMPNYRIRNIGSKFIIKFNEELSEESIFLLKEKLYFIPGIESFSFAKEFLLKDISINNIKEIIGSFITNNFNKDIVDVKVKRVGKHDFTSVELSNIIRTFIKEKGFLINYKNPKKVFFLELRENNIYFFLKKEKAIGGLPPNTGDKALMLFSGGIDSPVAAFELLKRGLVIDYLLINLGNNIFNELNVFKKISSYHFNNTKLFIVNGAPLIDFLKNIPNTLRQLALKVSFYHIAYFFLKEYNYKAIITGESLAQKSTQTIRSLSFITSLSPKMLILRPLLSFNKNDIVAMADRLGTLSYSQKVKELCNISSGPTTARPNDSHFKNLPSFEIFENLARDIFQTKKILLKNDIDRLVKENNTLSNNIFCKKNSNFNKNNLDLVNTLFLALDKDSFSWLKKKGLKTKLIKDIDDFKLFIKNSLKNSSSNDISLNNILFICKIGMKAKEFSFLAKNMFSKEITYYSILDLKEKLK